MRLSDDERLSSGLRGIVVMRLWGPGGLYWREMHPDEWCGNIKTSCWKCAVNVAD